MLQRFINGWLFAIFPGESCILLPDFEARVVEKLLQRIYISNDASEKDAKAKTSAVDKLASLLGINASVDIRDDTKCSVDFNFADIKGESLESRLEQLKMFNSGLRISRQQQVPNVKNYFSLRHWQSGQISLVFVIARLGSLI